MGAGTLLSQTPNDDQIDFLNIKCVAPFTITFTDTHCRKNLHHEGLVTNLYPHEILIHQLLQTSTQSLENISDSQK